MKNYYAVLGVTEQAEDVVIKAAYRALAQLYHPDKFFGTAEEATRRMSDINEAYGVLSDPVKRKSYDTEYKGSSGNEEDIDAGSEAADEGVKQVDKDWEIALEYYPDLADLEGELSKTSKSLAFTFRLCMIIGKEFKNRSKIAGEMHDAFLRNFFGDRPAILKFARLLIDLGRKDAAKALNEAVRVLGDEFDSANVIGKIKNRFGIIEKTGYKTICRPPLKSVSGKDAKLDDVKLVLEDFGGSFEISGGRIFASWKNHSGSFWSQKELLTWFQSELLPEMGVW